MRIIDVAALRSAAEAKLVKVPPETNAPETNAPETDAPETDALQCNGEDIHAVVVEEKAATCQERGYKIESCSICGEIISESAFPKAACTPIAAATCTADSVCSVCGDVIEEAPGHTFGDAVVVEATCLAEGSKTQTCSVCGEVVVRFQSRCNARCSTRRKFG